MASDLSRAATPARVMTAPPEMASFLTGAGKASGDDDPLAFLRQLDLERARVPDTAETARADKSEPPVRAAGAERAAPAERAPSPRREMPRTSSGNRMPPRERSVAAEAPRVAADGGTKAVEPAARPRPAAPVSEASEQEDPQASLNPVVAEVAPVPQAIPSASLPWGALLEGDDGSESVDDTAQVAPQSVLPWSAGTPVEMPDESFLAEGAAGVPTAAVPAGRGVTLPIDADLEAGALPDETLANVAPPPVLDDGRSTGADLLAAADRMEALFADEADLFRETTPSPLNSVGEDDAWMDELARDLGVQVLSTSEEADTPFFKQSLSLSQQLQVNWCAPAAEPVEAVAGNASTDMMTADVGAPTVLDGFVTAATTARERLADAETLSPPVMQMEAAVDPVLVSLKGELQQLERSMGSNVQRGRRDGLGSVTASATAEARPLGLMERESSTQNASAARPSLQTPVPLNRAAFAQAMTERIVAMMSQKVTSADIVLDPRELGPVEVRIRQERDQTSVMFLSHQPMVRDTLESQLPRLRELFADAGLSLGNVNVGSRSAGQEGQSSGRDWQASEPEWSEVSATPARPTARVSARDDGAVDFYA